VFGSQAPSATPTAKLARLDHSCSTFLTVLKDGLFILSVYASGVV
jgi:hypothetical protein